MVRHSSRPTHRRLRPRRPRQRFRPRQRPRPRVRPRNPLEQVISRTISWSGTPRTKSSRSTSSSRETRPMTPSSSDR
ncbi:hypothetical protein BRC71_04495 [Halobacteriales archaeon QH_7_65_31]|nr:MAG: hypothetical protein BRC71_04495 [Halobacteriales archaeon QH_7_65_31]